jgi:signal transduction histidine kinase
MVLEAFANTTAVAIENVRVYANMERLVEERTRDLQAVNEELEAFTSAASHDLRSPLRAMSAAVELLDAAPREQASLQKEQLRNHVLVMNRLIDDLLRLSRVTHAEMSLERCDLAALAVESLQRLQLTNPPRRMHWRVSGPMMANADPGLMRIALDNLLANAWKYSSNRDPAEIALTSHIDAHGRCVFAVSDNGAGFDPRETHRLFRPFQRLHSESEFAGAGLGLLTVQRIIARHGGSIWADARLGGGARFSFTLGDQAA